MDERNQNEFENNQVMGNAQNVSDGMSEDRQSPQHQDIKPEEQAQPEQNIQLNTDTQPEPSQDGAYGSERLNPNHRVEYVSGYGAQSGSYSSDINRYHSSAQSADSQENIDAQKDSSVYDTPDQEASTYRVYQESPTNPPEPDKKAKRERKQGKSTGITWSKTVVAAVIVGLVAGSAFKGIDIAYNHAQGDTQATAQESQKVDTVKTAATVSENQAIYDESEMAANVMPSIVSITTKSIETIQTWFKQYQQEVEGSGSGIIIEQSGNDLYILTNYHVIQGATSLTVGFSDETMVEASVKGYNADADLAVVVVDMTKMSSSTVEEIKLATLGDSDAVAVGEPAFAIGNALGYGQSFTGGYISAINRILEDSSLPLIQTDAAINPGNSGGALLNAKGEVIGINSSKLVDSTVEGMGFAIPINKAMELLRGIIDGTSGNVESSGSGSDEYYNEYGYGDEIDDFFNDFFGGGNGQDDDNGSTEEQEIQQSNNKAFLGIVGTSITEEYSEYLNMPVGVYITQVTDDSPAQQAGLAAGDVITAVDGTDYTSMEDLSAYIGEKEPGDTISITFQRKNNNGTYETQTTSATLAKNENVQ